MADSAPAQAGRAPGNAAGTSARVRLQGADTFPKILLVNAKALADRPANREKDLGIWQTWSWAQVLGQVESLALGLKALGFARGDKLAMKKLGDKYEPLATALACFGIEEAELYISSGRTGFARTPG